MKKDKTTNQEAEVEMGDFGPIYKQFEGKPQKAIEFLRKMQTDKARETMGINSFRSKK